jgi:hypothetical protein
MYVDVMHIDGHMFLVSVTDPLNLTLQTKVMSENKLELGMALQGHMAVLRSRGFEPSTVYTDPHSLFRSMTQDFPGVEMDIGGAGDYVSKADAKIRRIKETYRKVKSGLPWELPGQLVGDLVAYCVSRLNIRRTTSLSENICPRVLFTGVPVDYKKELTYAFGDYVEAYEGTTNTSRARSSACIALFPTGNSIGSWVLWKIDTRSHVRRSNMEKLVTTDMIINVMNAVSEEEREREPEHRDTTGGTAEDGPDNNPGEIPAETQEQGPEEIQLEVNQDEILPETQDESETTAEEIAADEAEEEEEGEQEEPRTTTRSGRQVVRPSCFAVVTKVSQKQWQQEQARKAINKELIQLFEELEAIVPIKRQDIPKDVTILNSHMFLINKYDADGEFEKVKARLVADGRNQDPAMYPNKSSPTVAIHSIFTVLGMAAETLADCCKNRYQRRLCPDADDGTTDLHETGPESDEICEGTVPRTQRIPVA